MPNDKKKTNPPKGRRKARGPSKQKSTAGKTDMNKPLRPMRVKAGFSSSKPSRSAIEAVCSQSDPFCIHAKGAKMLDRSMTPSVAYQVIQNGVLATITTTGQATIQIGAGDCIQGTRTALTYTGSTVATWSARSVPPGATWLTDNAHRFRVVSFGVRFFSTVAPVNASGLYICATSGEQLDAPNHDSSSWLEVTRDPLAGAQGTWIGKPRDDEYASYVAVTSPSTSSTYNTYCTLSIAGGPLASPTSVLGYQIIWNVEAVMDSANASVHLSTPAAPHVPRIEAAVAKVMSHTNSTVPGPTANVSEIIYKHAANALDNALEKGLAYGMRMLMA